MNKTLKISLVACLLSTLNLNAQENNLGMITVYGATKSEQSIKDITSNIEVIDGVELEEKHINTLTEALNLVSGVSFSQNGGLGKSSSLRVRGFDTKRVLVLVNGIRYNDHTSTGGPVFENIMLDEVSKIEVIKGAQSGIWGADASAGVINIITKKPKEGVHGSVFVERGSFQTKKHGANLSHSTKNYHAKVSYSKIKTDGFTSYAKYGEDIKKFDEDGYENETASFDFGYKIDDNNKVNLFHSNVKSKSEFDNPTGDFDHRSSAKTKLYSVKYENRLDDILTSVRYNKSDFFRDYTTFGSKYDGVIENVELKSNIKYLDGTSFVTVGGEYKNFDQKDVVNKDYTNKAFFITNSNTFNDKTTITESIRVDGYDSFEDKTTGKLGIKYNYNKDFSLSANVGTAYNVPKLFEMFGAFGANENLKAETTTSYDLSAKFKDIKITYFYNTIEDMISYDMGVSKYNNILGKSKIKGLEIDYKKVLSEDILFNLNYTNLSAKDKDDKVLARRAKDNLKFGVDYYGIDKLHLGLNGEYIGTRYDRKDKQGRQTGRYTIANLVINYDITRDIKVYGKIDNITDKYYQNVDGYATSPRAYYAGIKYSF
jgi:vitamin B12 transporter